uniref:Uncharacterized protein n=1 Tax=Romanomermis culicivorax TaxID=13658 RepID=A0A915HVU5_ROMCU
MNSGIGVQRQKIVVPLVQQPAANSASASGASHSNASGGGSPLLTTSVVGVGDGAEKFLRPANPPTVKSTSGTSVSSTANQTANKQPGSSGEKAE